MRRYWLLGSVSTLLLVTALSLAPLQQLPPAPGSDKLHHLLAYACVMFPTALRRPPALALWPVGFLAWSGAIELLQPLVNRYAEWADLAANATGLCLGILAGLLAAGWLQQRNDAQSPFHK